MKIFPPNATDAYKTGHVFQYEPGTEMVYSNDTCRSGKYMQWLPDFDGKTVEFGLQGACKWFLRDMWNEQFFQKPHDQVIARYARRMDTAMGPGAVTVDHMSALHKLGYLPLQIKALKEGSRVNLRVPGWTIRNTHKDFAWVTNYVETPLSAETWKPKQNATTAYEFYRLFKKYADLTGCPADFVKWQGHDFSMRGMSGIHDAANAGSGPLVPFYGTDTLLALDYLEDYYKGSETFLGGSVPATEHSVMCMGQQAGELETIERIATKLYPSGIVSVVSDTWDFFQVITTHLQALKPKILARQDDANGNSKYVSRPDSGDPFKILCGDTDAIIGSPEYRGAIRCLLEGFETTTNSLGFTVMNRKVGLIYGDGITLNIAFKVLDWCYRNKICTSCIVFGIGSYTYQGVTRDTLGQAIKSTYGIVNGVARELYKDPVTDSGMKRSARGLLRVEKEGDGFVLHEMQTWEEEERGELETVFLNSEVIRDQSIAEIRTILGV